MLAPIGWSFCVKSRDHSKGFMKNIIDDGEGSEFAQG
jgi:hypothetical protein